jgi:tryptophan-rich sensory protein
VLFFGARQLTVPELTPRRVFIPMCLGIAVMAGAATYYLHAQGLDNSVGGRSAYIIQLSISFLYVPLMLRQPTLEYFSFNANWLRAAGSALVVVFFFLHFPQDAFLLTIGCAAAVVDAVFLYLFVQKRRRLAVGAPVIRNAAPA